MEQPLRQVVFISYANEAMAYSLKRIGRQARKLGIFDKVILYTPADVPEYVRKSPLFACPRGAGYWSWKPALLYETLQKYDEGTVVVYVDAGCTLRKSPEWARLLGKMEEYDTICFQYAEPQPQWARWGAGSSKIKHWTKKATLDFVQDYFHNPEAGELCQIMGPTADELEDQYPWFAGHRHDQAILTPLAASDPHTLVLPEVSEAYRPDSFVWASRIRARDVREYIPIQVKHYLRIWLGDGLFERIKRVFK